MSATLRYVMIKHYRGAPASDEDAPMDTWTPQEVADHVQHMEDLAQRLRDSGEFVDSLALSPEAEWVRRDADGTPSTDMPFSQTKDLVAGWMIIEVASRERALEIASELSAAPGRGGRPIREWLELRPVLTGHDSDDG